MKHILHCLPSLPRWIESQVPTAVWCSTLPPLLASFPSLSHFHFPTSASWDHLPHQLLALKSLSQDLLLRPLKLRQHVCVVPSSHLDFLVEIPSLLWRSSSTQKHSLGLKQLPAPWLLTSRLILSPCLPHILYTDALKYLLSQASGASHLHHRDRSPRK